MSSASPPVMTDRQLAVFRAFREAQATLNGLGVFLALPELSQLKFVDHLAQKDAITLLDVMVKLTERSDSRTIPYAVLERLLERCDEEQHAEGAQDATIRLALHPDALAQVRAETRRLDETARAAKRRHTMQLAIDAAEVDAEVAALAVPERT